VSFLLDTNVISEVVKPEPHPRVVAWLEEVEEDLVFLSVASLAEIRRGLELMDPGRRRDRLNLWLNRDLPARFAGRILAIDSRIAQMWGIVMARGKRAGLNVAVLDAFFAATAQAHGLTLVTRNVQDFEKLEIPLLNPWASVA
jgi:predicted nucleic acid-binding protein